MDMPEIEVGMIVESDYFDGFRYVTGTHSPDWVEVHEIWNESEKCNIQKSMINVVYARASFATDSNSYVNLDFARIWPPTPKKMTHADIAEALGHDFELVEG